jgi:hypothetical protein
MAVQVAADRQYERLISNRKGIFMKSTSPACAGSALIRIAALAASCNPAPRPADLPHAKRIFLK